MSPRAWERVHETLHASLDLRGRSLLSAEVLRAALAEAFGGTPFPPVAREPWARGWAWPAHVSRRSLTGWSARHRVVVEYRGPHHYSPEAAGSQAQWQWQQRQDGLLEERCTDAELALIVVPYYITFTRLRDYVRYELHLLGYELSKPRLSDEELYDEVFQRCFEAGFTDERLVL